MPVGSGWHVAAAAIQGVIQPVLGGATVEIIPRGGGVTNPMVVERGTAQIAFSNVQTAVLAAQGDALCRGQRAENVRALVGGLNSVHMGVMVRDGRADILFGTVLRGHPTITEISLTADVRFLGLSEHAEAALARLGRRPAMMPNWFQGQSGETRSGDSGTVLIAHASVPEETAYRIVRPIVENRDRLVQDYPAFAEWDPLRSHLPENTGVALHRGAARYVRECGWMS